MIGAAKLSRWKKLAGKSALYESHRVRIRCDFQAKLKDRQNQVRSPGNGAARSSFVMKHKICSEETGQKSACRGLILVSRYRLPKARFGHAHLGWSPGG